MERNIGPLFVDDGGSGNVPVLFVHSAAGNTTHFDAQLAHLRKARRAAALDLRGHGRSKPPPDGDYRIESMAGDVAAVADGLGFDRFVLAGHSMGGAVAVAYAGQHPERLAGLLLLDPASDGRKLPKELTESTMKALRGPAYLESVEAYWAPMLEPSSAAVRTRLAHDLRSTSHEAIVGPLGALLTFDPVLPLEAFTGPKLSVITRFNETPASYQALVPSLPHRKIEGTGHWLHLDAPDAVNRMIDEFFATVPARA